MKTRPSQIALIIALLFVIVGMGDIQELKGKKVYLKHPGLTKGETGAYYLNSSNNELYYIDVKSVLCAEKVCKVVPVRVVWNKFGEYQEFKMINGATLEKLENGKVVPFNTSDYKLLHEILSDKKSPFKNLTYAEITKTYAHGEGDELDGRSGATAIMLEEGESIIGATWTCYTLWHWVHGDAVEEIRNYSAENLSDDRLLEALKSRRRNQQNYAINAIINQELYSSALWRELTTSIALYTDDQIRLLVNYLEKAKPSDFDIYCTEWFHEITPEKHIHFLRNLFNSTHNISSKFVADLYINLPLITDYAEFDAFIHLLDKRQLESEEINAYVGRYLSNNTIFSRRAYWYLQDKNLTKEQIKSMKKYKRINKKVLQ
ncbi:hypothetical protein [Flammeovirga kamogawensis]|uniref:Uncharacterized protein n=1 Tax=Flammeovirga kamogawensis TaxID=373891 RepID=A0ABX8H4M0_9BACT|nr:hypothetical protein [Flammeovirga kamogawensis]MBB6461708.1 hypothetical protein [Flammeovirga kamogawensis]QWG10628.1 hypothetical protein KM029_24920 [Flammeovirga kamogawensis]TRX63733.1 hypothetical protein EO216_25300 [Flammeovirga kamogawensis]